MTDAEFELWALNTISDLNLVWFYLFSYVFRKVFRDYQHTKPYLQ